ncbi:hypothetical protein EDB19DRAFT_1839605 [Suillus lakei]|nr:hypothetical protein EDB19DRAFT_1839605 [Suillus lakei]
MAGSESPAIMPQQTKPPLIKAEIAVLKAHLEDWRSVKGKQRNHIPKAIHKEACPQAPTWDKALLKARKKEWLYNQCCRKAPKPLIKYDKKWTAHRVLIEQNKAHILEETREMPGSEAMIVKWPEATKTVLAGLSAEEEEEANVLADKWNNEATPPKVQANLAEPKGADMIEHFTTEMFKLAGMRVFVMSAWRDSRGKLMLGAHDHNDQFGGADSFMKTRNWDEIFMPELLSPYLSEKSFGLGFTFTGAGGCIRRHCQLRPDDGNASHLVLQWMFLDLGIITLDVGPYSISMAAKSRIGRMIVADRPWFSNTGD